MLRKISWIVIGGALLAGVSAKAQYPAPRSYGTPALPGYPGYPAMPSRPLMPAMPLMPATPISPAMPQGPLPPVMPAPGMTYQGQPGGMPPAGMMLPNQLPPAGLPNPKAIPTQPYMVLPDRVPTSKIPALPTVQSPNSGSGSDQPPGASVPYSDGGEVLPASYFPPQPLIPTEPFTVYEGPRYLSYIKEEGTRMWVQAGFLHWWVNQDNYPPLVTTGTAAANPGLLGNADTTVLLGGRLGPTEFSGFQGTLGIWLNPELEKSLEVTGFFLGRHGRDNAFTSDAAGNPALSVPFLAPAESVAQIAIPGTSSGRISANSVMDLHGIDVAVVANIARINGWSFDYLWGFRYLYLNDDFAFNQSITALVDNGVFFNGAGQVAGSTVSISDSFNLTNRFYGGQFGGRVAWNWWRFDIGVSGKVSMGGNVSRAVITGSSTLNPGTAGATTADGGFFAQPSNSGSHTVSIYSVVPEATATVGFHITPNLRVFGTYSMLYWTNVIRSGSNLDRQINPATPPTSGAFVAGSTGSPVFNANYTDFWAHGLNVGLELKY